jgi:deoxyribodipyrimidine photolyase-related protein
MSSVSLVFPHQLFKQNPALNKNRKVILVEEELFFNQYKFHKQKIVLHRASMKFYEVWIRSLGYAAQYIEAITPLADIRRLIKSLHKEGIISVHYTDTTDNWLEKRIKQACHSHNMEVVKYPSPNFLNNTTEAGSFFDNRKTYFQTDFYIHQRKQRKILLEAESKPLGGKWTYDAENRERFPKKGIAPTIDWPKNNSYVKEAIDYTEKHFSHHYGQSTFADNKFYPVTFDEAEKWLDEFLKIRFNQFGIYEDAIVSKEHFLHHSVLTPMLNIGLLNPQQIIDKSLDAAVEHTIPLNSLEGFVRQIIGWREFIKIVYEREGSKQRTKNYWGFTRKIPASFWKGEIGIAPVDITIKKILATGYSHHIERLMVMGNFMLLCEFDPDEVYRWFMEMYVDSYDWVMVPNVYGMTQFADGGLMTTKPYISGSNYLLKMSDYEKGEWTKIWDGLFWRFMHVHRDFFLQNPRLGMLIKTFDKMPEEKQQAHLTIAETYLNKLDEESR